MKTQKSKVTSQLNFNKNEIMDSTNDKVNLIRSAVFDSKERAIDISIKNLKRWLLRIRNIGLSTGAIVSWAVVIWAVCILTSAVKHYSDTVILYIEAKEPLILWMHGLSVCSLMALIITLCLSLIRIFSNKRVKIKPKTAVSAFIEAMRKNNKDS